MFKITKDNIFEMDKEQVFSKGLEIPLVQIEHRSVEMTLTKALILMAVETSATPAPQIPYPICSVMQLSMR